MVCGTSQITTKVCLFRIHHNVFNYLNFFFCVRQIVQYSQALSTFHQSHFLLLSYIFYTFMGWIIHSFTITILPFIKVSHQLYPLISIHIFSTVSITCRIISQSISYNNFHTCFHILHYWGVNGLDSFYSCVIFLSHNIHHSISFVWAFNSQTYYLHNIFSRFLLLFDTLLILFWSIYYCVCMHIRPLFNWVIFTNISCFNLWPLHYN